MLDRDFFRRDAVTVARELIGKKLVRYLEGEKLSLRIVETEAYCGPEDEACHASGGRRTERTEPMFLQGGHLYIYLIYGIHRCLNIVAAEVDSPHAVLIRAGEPLEGIELMRENRTLDDPNYHQIAGGAGRICQALSLDEDYSGLNLLKSEEIHIEYIDEGERICDDDGENNFEIVSSSRINIDYAGDTYRNKPWRFYLKNSSCLSV
ncbi:DNA-3-methyladenine glycosylase [Halarsenatibacter silvermanii]|uniref:Putative 3-methyladenine DNA glycosylase n=1 Tax=Halarsenatibacter silvermanii TaxID=321763 RepID=A0A1G9KKN3_9FIRM|nr:DNA-3-methyladenine glycosylase [Halarsenatibacter silvermanii]SDL50281.1 DNA-3-methyladenine glycosylase [Halarsenatibacter silvermanii]